MFGIGMTELMVILVIALLVLGPTKLPQAARTIGKGLRELRRASDDIRTAVMWDDDTPDYRRRKPPPPARALEAHAEDADIVEVSESPGFAENGEDAESDLGAHDDKGIPLHSGATGTVARGDSTVSEAQEPSGHDEEAATHEVLAAASEKLDAAKRESNT